MILNFSQGIKVQYHDVRVNFELAKAADLLCHSGAANSSAVNNLQLQDTSLLVNYIYLDSEERKRFAQASHEYLIEQLQFTGSETVNTDKPRIRLNFNHPCKELVWNVQLEKWTNGSKYLAWLPSDPAAMRDLATRRFVTMCANVVGTSISVMDATDSRVMFKSSFTSASTLQGKFNAVGAQVIGAISTGNVVVNATFNDITYENPLQWSDVSTPVDDLIVNNAGSTLAYNTGNTFALPMVVNDHFNYATQLDKNGIMLDTALLQLNGHDRFDEQEGTYFNYVQPWESHSATPSDGVNVYSFALNPEDHQPSGTCNFSRIDNATLNLNFVNGTVNSTKTGTLNVYAVNYNVLRVMSGIRIFASGFRRKPPVPNSQIPLKFSNILDRINIIKLERCKIILYNWLVDYKKSATKPNCGKLLKFITTKSTKQFVDGQAKSLVYGNNVINWIIRNQRPYFYKVIGSETIWFWGIIKNNLIRYSPPYSESYGISCCNISCCNISCCNPIPGVVLIIGPKRYFANRISSWIMNYKIINPATHSNCGKLLKFNLLNINSNINVAQNKNCGRVTMIEIYGQSATNWLNSHNAQRLNVCGLELYNSSLRYSLVPRSFDGHKYGENQGILTCLQQLNIINLILIILFIYEIIN